MSRVVPSIPVELDKTRHLKVSFGAMQRYKAATGKKLSMDFTNMEIDEMMREICVLLWASLAHEDEELTVEQVEEMIGPANLNYVQEKLFEAMGMSMPEVKDEEDPLAMTNRPNPS
jgi:hypothetical protein